MIKPLVRPAARIAVVMIVLWGGAVSIASPAAAATTTLCQGYAGCRQSGRSDSGYEASSGTSYWGMYPGHNCTNYAAYRLVRNGVDASYLRGHGNAYEWGGQASQHGVRVDRTPAVGAIAWWQSGSGHVAYVEQVLGDGSIVTSEDNYGGDFYWKQRSPGDYPTAFLHFADQPTNHAPVATFDSATATAPGTVRVTGWAFDPDAPAQPVHVHMYVGGPSGSGAPGFDLGATSAARPDVQAAYPGVGPTAGFDTTVTSRGGPVTLYMYAIDLQGGTNPLVGTKTVTVAEPNPNGSFDGVRSPSGGLVTVTGWNYDPNAPAQRIHTHVYVGGPAGSGAPGYDIGPSWQARPDVQQVYPVAGKYTGFVASVPAPAGTVPVYAYAINVGTGQNVLLGSRTVTVAAGPRAFPAPGARLSNLASSTSARTLAPRWAGLTARPSAVVFDVAYRSRVNRKGTAYTSWVHPKSWTYSTARGGSVAVRGARVYQFIARVRQTTTGPVTSRWSTPVTVTVR